MLRENASATATPCLENLLAKPLPKQNSLEEMMRTSPFVWSKPILLEVVKSSKECNSEDTLHFCERWTIITILDRVWASFLWPRTHCYWPWSRYNPDFSQCISWDGGPTGHGVEAPTLESKGKDSTYVHRSFTPKIPRKLCSSNASPESGTLSAPQTYEKCNHLKVFSCKIFRRVVVDAFVYRKHYIFSACTVALTF